MKIQAAVAYPDQERFTVEEVELDEPRDDEILVRIAGVGVCHTDLVFASGHGLSLPAVLGHEGSGVVDRVGTAVSKVAPGDRVVVTSRSCGGCDLCVRGECTYCRSYLELNFAGVRKDGSKSISGGMNGAAGISSNFFGQSSFASRALTYERDVVKVPDDVPLELMGPLACGVQTGVGAVMRSFDAEEGSSILIMGGGSVGLSAVMGAKVRRCDPIIVVEPVSSRRELARSLGATHAIDPTSTEDLAASVKEIVTLGVNYALEASGVPEMLTVAMSCLGTKGTLGVIGVYPPGTTLPGDALAFMGAGQAIRGIIVGDSDLDTFIQELIELYKRNELPFDKLIRFYPLSDINQAIADQAKGECVKPVLIPEDNGTSG